MLNELEADVGGEVLGIMCGDKRFGFTTAVIIVA